MIIRGEKIEFSPAIQYINIRQLGVGEGEGVGVGRGGGSGAYTRLTLDTVFYFIGLKKRGLETYQHCAMLAANYDFAR